jgi:hypothetical protein
MMDFSVGGLVSSHTSSRKNLVLSVVLILLASPSLAQAYVDPGSGAMVWQVAAAAVISSVFYLRRFRLKLKDFTRSRKNDSMSVAHGD